MYKDVWKKFGMKVLIVLCSVLLLGGVAIAAPRLRAAPSEDFEIDLGRVGTPDGRPSTAISGAAIVITNESALEYNNGNEVLPALALTYNDNGSPRQIPLTGNNKEDYELTRTVGDWTQAGEVTVTMTASLKPQNQYLKAGSSCSFSYKIKQARLSGDISYTTNNPSEYADDCGSTQLAVSSKDTALTSTQLNVAVNGVTINTGEYSVSGTNGSDTEAKPGSLGKYTCYIKLNNYFRVTGGGNNTSYWPAEIDIVKHVKQLNAQLDGVPFDSYPSGAPAVNNPVVTVSDPDNGSVPLVEDTHYRVSSADTADGRKITITGMGNYIGSRTREYSLTKPALAFRFADAKYNSVQEYNEDKNTYRFDPDQIIMTVTPADGSPASEITLNKTDFEVTNCMIVQGTGSAEGIEGATAGLVRMEFEVKMSGYTGQKGVLHYTVRRNIANAIEGDTSSANQKLNLNAPIPEDSADVPPYTYNKNKHMMMPDMYFSLSREDAAKPMGTYTLNSVTNDYEVSYSVMRGGVLRTDLTAGVDAGTVIMTITGTAGARNGGYYGTIIGSDEVPNATYEIQPADVEKDGYFINLSPNSYPLKTDETTIIKNAALRRTVGTSTSTAWNIDPNKRGAEYSVAFYDAATIDEETGQRKKVTNLSNAAPGDYIVEFNFKGNYTGKLDAGFKIQAHNSENVVIKVAGACGQDEGDKHVYNGSEHEPDVQVWSNILNEYLTEGDSAGFTLRYENNVNSGTAKVYITLAGNPDPIEEEFKIEKRTLTQDTDHFFTFLDEDGFTTAGTGATHEYCGKGNAPELSGLTYTYRYTTVDGKTVTKRVSLTSDTDFTFDKNVLYDAGDSLIDMRKLDTGTDYYYRITPAKDGNFLAGGRRNYVLVGPFRFTAKNINTEYIKGEVDTPMPWENFADDAAAKAKAIEWLVNKKHLTVTDTEYTPGQVLSTDDYDVVFDESEGDGNFISTKGIIRFGIEGKGCYEGQKHKLELPVGKDISGATVREKNYEHKSLSGDMLQFQDFYTESGDEHDRYGLNFNTTPDQSKSCTNVYYDGNIIAYGQKYTAEQSDIVLDEDPDGKSYAVVTLQGINGYYGKAQIKIWIDKIDIADCEIEILEPETLIYTGSVITPEIRVWRKGADHDKDRPIAESNYEVIVGDRNIDACEQHPETNKTSYWAYITVRGKYGFKGSTREYFIIYRRDISKPDPDSPAGDNIMAPEFKFEGFEDPITYRPYTETEVEGRHDGTWQDATLWFNPNKSTAGSAYTKLKGGTDYSFVCENAKKAGKAQMVVTGKGNFKGTFSREYTISPASFKKDCIVSLKDDDDWFPFTGSEVEPTVVVKQKIGDDIYDLTLNKDYQVEYKNNIFVSKNKDGDLSLTNGTYLIVKPIDGDNNFTEEKEMPYVIYGNLNPAEDAPARENSKLNVGDDETIIVPYADPMSYDSLKLSLLQKPAGGAYNQPGASDEYDMYWNQDYTVSCSDETLGVHPATIRGTGSRANKGKIIGEKRMNLTIQANLKSNTNMDPAVLWQKNGGTNNIRYSAGAEFTEEDLAKMLNIQCGGRGLVYGEDYQFKGTVSSALGGPYTIIVEPTEEANLDSHGVKDLGYLTGSFELTYYVKADIEGDVKVENLKEEYVYAHGVKVIDPQNDDFGVTINGKVLKNRTDYTVEVTKDGEASDPVDCGTYKVTIHGSGDYAGEIIRTIKIVPYDFEADYAKDRVAVSLESDTVTYTGGAVYPNVTKVAVRSGTGSSGFTLKEADADGNGDYGIRAGRAGSNVNWTDVENGDALPTVIVYGTGNYTGEITNTYRILKKDITNAEDVVIAAIKGLFYQNGKEIKPYPEITYGSMTLSGIEYASADADKYDHWKEYGTHFTYQYLNDVKSTGSKEIEIRGIGNFTGARTVSYTVDPLDLSRTKISFLSESAPVYNGQEQRPAFQLTYDDVVILTFMNNSISSNHLSSSNVSWEFKNNINATRDDSKASVTVKVEGDTDNYKGEVTGSFAILPASLSDHTKFLYHPAGENGNVDLSTYKMNLPFTGNTQQPQYASGADLAEGQVGMFFNDAASANHGTFLIGGTDYDISYMYVEPDTNDVEVREEYRNPNPPFSYAGKVRVTVTGKGNYADSASFWYFIGKDISEAGSVRLDKTTAVYNSQVQAPTAIVSGIDVSEYTVVKYRGEVDVKNIITDKGFVNAGTYYVRIEGAPAKGTYATKPFTLTYTITARPISSEVVIDGFQKEYSFTGRDICPTGISVTDYIDRVKYKLTENVDYTLSYSNNLNAGTAIIYVNGQNNFSGTASARFLITSSTISSGGSDANSPSNGGTGEISGSTAVSPEDVSLTMDTNEAMYYTGSPVYPKVSIKGMTENVDYTVTYSNNVEVGTATMYITGIGNNSGVITKNFKIIAQLSKCTVAPIPAQQYTGSAVTPALTITCGSNILQEGSDYTVTFANNINIGTATAMINAGKNSNYVGSTTARFSIGNDVGAFIISGFAPSYVYTGAAITPGVVVETGSATLTQGIDYTVSYANNVNAGTATITVTGIGKYSGTQTADFVITPKSIQSCDTTGVSDQTYTGNAYTPSITVSDGSTELKSGVDYTITYANNTNPGVASIIIQGISNNYSGTKTINFKIASKAVTGLKASSIKYSSLKLKWTKQGYADGYQICDSKSKVVENVTKNSASITGLSAGKTYKYKVRSYIRNADGSRSYSEFSPVVSATTKLKTPAVKITSTKKSQARISWSKVSGATGYEIYYKKSAGAKYKKVKTINKANTRICNVRGLKSGSKAYFRVRAFKKSGSTKIYSSLNPLKVIKIK